MSNIMPNTDEVSNKYHLPIQMRLKFGNSHGEEILGSAAAFRARSVERREELRPCTYNARSKVFWEKYNIPTTSWSSPNGPGLRMVAPVNSEPSTQGYIPVTRAQMVAAGRSEPATVCKICREEYIDDRDLFTKLDCPHSYCDSCTRELRRRYQYEGEECVSCYWKNKDYHNCGHRINTELHLTAADYKRAYRKRCHKDCRGTLKIQYSRISNWLVLGHEDPLQIMRWLMDVLSPDGGMNPPSELLWLLQWMCVLPPVPFECPPDLDRYVVRELMARAPSPSWPMWVAGEGAFDDQFGCIRLRTSSSGREFYAFEFLQSHSGPVAYMRNRHVPMWQKQGDSESNLGKNWAQTRLWRDQRAHLRNPTGPGASDYNWKDKKSSEDSHTRQIEDTQRLDDGVKKVEGRRREGEH